MNSRVEQKKNSNLMILVTIFMPSPCVTGQVAILSSLSQLIFSFCRRVIYHSKGLREYIPILILSVCQYHDLQTNSWTSFLSQIFYIIHQWICLNELCKRMGSFFPNFKFFFELMTENQKILKRIVMLEY